ncbi:hypothetical protein AX16_003163 [Volvariella volvacea WC 439]|nr:hypothetical protein AX16_003163 [Volvariella volvacea WC 439]
MGTKRRALTADVLLKQLEELPSKKPRRIAIEDPVDNDSDAATSDRSQASLDDPGPSNFSKDEDEDEDEDDGHDVTEDRRSKPRIVSSSRIAFKGGQPTILASTSTTKSVSKPLSSFTELGISAFLQRALEVMSIRAPTEVQAACIPPLLAGRDCVGNAKTGSGKTIAFALPILQALSIDPYGIYALVLTPTRELAFQISEQFAVLGGPLHIRTAVVVGGMDMMAQALELGRHPHVVIATPGRIVDHLRSSRGEWDLSKIKFLVLDEADRLLTPTFAPELSYLFDILPKERQTCLFTATLTPSIDTLIAAPPRPGKQKLFVHRMSESVETVSTLNQHFILVPSHVREVYLYYFLCNPPESTLHLRRTPIEPAKGKAKTKPKRKGKSEEDEGVEQPPPTIIFCARSRTAAYLTLVLKSLSIRSTALHSRLTQRERLTSLSLFRGSVVPVLVCTGVGARGLDIEDVALVINWDLPNEPEEYTHRVGRTARAGRGGTAVSFVTERDEERVLRIEDRIKTKLTEMTLPEGKVLEKLNTVSTAKRLAQMELHDSDFGRREEIHRLKQEKRRQDVGANDG